MILGCAMPEGEQGLNVARIASLRAGVPIEASAVTVNRFCSSGLQAIAYGAERIMLGHAQVVVAGGTESMSMVPMGGNKVSPNPGLVDTYPDVYLSTGLVAENHARLSGISREQQDAFALRSHQRALAAIEPGRFKDEIVPLDRSSTGSPNGVRGTARARSFDIDEGPRRDTSPEALAQAAAGVSCDRHRDRRQFVADERRRRGGRPHVGRVRQGARPEAARAIRRLRHRRRGAGAVRHRAGASDQEGAEARRPDARSDRSRSS